MCPASWTEARCCPPRLFDRVDVVAVEVGARRRRTCRRRSASVTLLVPELLRRDLLHRAREVRVLLRLDDLDLGLGGLALPPVALAVERVLARPDAPDLRHERRFQRSASPGCHVRSSGLAFGYWSHQLFVKLKEQRTVIFSVVGAEARGEEADARARLVRILREARAPEGLALLHRLLVGGGVGARAGGGLCAGDAPGAGAGGTLRASTLPARERGASGLVARARRAAARARPRRRPAPAPLRSSWPAPAPACASMVPESRGARSTLVLTGPFHDFQELLRRCGGLPRRWRSSVCVA